MGAAVLEKPAAQDRIAAVKSYAILMSRRILGASCFGCIWIFQRRMGITSPLVGMLAVFSSLLVLEKAQGSDGIVASVFSALEPGYRFLVKWITVFFVPALVAVPLVETDLSSAVMMFAAVLLLAGFFATFTLTATVARAFPAPSAEAAEPEASLRPEPAVQTQHTQPPRVPHSRFVAGMLLGSLAARLGAPEAGEALFLACASVLGFTLGRRVPSKVQKYVHPLFACAGATFGAAAAWSKWAGTGAGFLDVIRVYTAWPGGGALLNFLLPVTLVSLSLLLYENRRLLLRDLAPILLTSLASSISTLATTLALAHTLHLPAVVALASLSRCIMTPFAAEAARTLGTFPALAVAMTICSGLLGAVLGQVLFDALRLRGECGRASRARGMAVGCTSHGIGSIPLSSTDRKGFAYGCVAFITTGSITSLLIQCPPVRTALLLAAGATAV